MAENITLKSTQDGLALRVREDAAFPDFMEELRELLGTHPAFFSGSEKPAVFIGREFTPLQKKEISRLLTDEYGMRDLRFASDFEAKLCERIKRNSNVMIFENVKKGRKLYSEGDIIVFGDVLSGAELIAAGNIIVFGKLYGSAHAGASGNEKACIAAESLLARQVRISNFVGTLPERRECGFAEAVSCEGEKLVIRRAA